MINLKYTSSQISEDPTEDLSLYKIYSSPQLLLSPITWFSGETLLACQFIKISFCNLVKKNPKIGLFNLLSNNPTKLSNTLKTICRLPINCLSVSDHFVGLVL